MMIRKHSKETRQKMSDSQKARWRSMSDEDRMSISMKIRQNAIAKRAIKKRIAPKGK